MDYTVHGVLQARILKWVVFPLSRGIFLIQGSNPGLPHCRQILYQPSHKGSPRMLEWVAYPFSNVSSRPRTWTGISWIAGGFFTNWAIREAFFFFPFIFISWRLITLQHCCGFCHTLKWISHGFTCIPHPGPPPTSLSTRFLWVFPMHQAWALVSCIQPGLVICFTLDNIHVSMLFCWSIPPSPSPTESTSLFYTSESLFLFCI